jgi:MoaA/NifB/PqqE/SkfB family radical SAM enzyme
MPVDRFETIVRKVRSHTDYIYLHVLGEPLSHPHLDKIIDVARATGLNVNLTTNGSLLTRHAQYLKQHPIRQINFSLHDAEENVSKNRWEFYLDTILKFATDVSQHTYISLRLWNGGNQSSLPFNQVTEGCIQKFFSLDESIFKNTKDVENIKLGDHIFLQYAPRFVWPEEQNPLQSINKTCYALRDHVAILTDGTVVPCCLDADAKQTLGNILESDLESIVNVPLAVKIKKGFEQHRAVTPFCIGCGFRV